MPVILLLLRCDESRRQESHPEARMCTVVQETERLGFHAVGDEKVGSRQLLSYGPGSSRYPRTANN